MKRNNISLWYFIASGLLLILLFIIQLKYPEILELETKWLIIALVPLLVGIILKGLVRKVKGFGIELEISPSSKPIGDNEKEEKLEDVYRDLKKLPADYYYINHTSFLRQQKQDEFKKRTKLNRPHYDIRVIIDSYYNCALSRIKYVKYYLHKNYPEPIQLRSNSKNKFCLKEIAWGEYVIVAKVYMKDISKPIILERYITLWDSGPRLD
ncbi:pYEATS domain-containing protein [Christiangramia crocea]|uniref:YEATS domain-containing protein n=1 Tax=Christiangramia crocea TaxID=2904124 RepID=A0A9X1UUU6_9FLAO|nr:pYEATS domain-containing protein [Gramella crocea]MCG9970521.1 hypothetical protein [Gramella crocea]